MTLLSSLESFYESTEKASFGSVDSYCKRRAPAIRVQCRLVLGVQRVGLRASQHRCPGRRDSGSTEWESGGAVEWVF